MTYDNFFKHIGILRQDVSLELSSPHHASAAKAMVDEFCNDLDYKSVVEFGCGAAPVLDIMKEKGRETLGITLNNEPVNHKLFKEDMHFTDLKDNSYDMAISRHSLEHSPMPLIMLMEMKRVAKKYALIAVPTPTKRMINFSGHYSVLTDMMWRRLFKVSRWNVLKFKRANYFYNEFGFWDAEYRYLLN